MSRKALYMKHLPLYRDYVRGTWNEGFFIEDSKRHVMGGSGNGAFFFVRFHK
jgi:hypothetical protein